MLLPGLLEFAPKKRSQFVQGLSLSLIFVLPALLVPSPAAATPTLTTPQIETEPPVAAEPSTEPPAVGEPTPLKLKAYENEFGVSQQTAEDHLATQERGVGIVRELEDLQGKDYAGVWFDNETSKFVVPVVTDTDSQSVESSLDSSYLMGDYRIKPVEYTWEELQAAQEHLDKNLTPMLEKQSISTSLDPRTNAIVISRAEVAPDEQAEIDQAVNGSGVNTEIRPIDAKRIAAEPFACKHWEKDDARVCDKPLRAGVYIDSAGKSVEVICTAGFKAIGNTYGNRFMLTAGHCYAHSADWASRESEDFSHYVGHSEAGAFPTNDYAAIRVNGYGTWWEEGTSWPSEVVYWGGSQNLSVEYESSSYMGEAVCHSGTSSGSSCGFVSALDKTITYGGSLPGTVYHLTEASGGELCTLAGDSGGPVWTGSTALGLLSGSMTSSCGGNLMYYTEVTEDDSLLQVTVGTPAGAPPYATTTAASAVVGHEATGNGTVDPNGLSTSYHFDYGTTTGYGSSTSNVGAGSGWGPSAVGGTIGGLQPVTTYHYRLVASNSAGISYGGDQVFTTTAAPPIVTTEAASGVKAHSATLHATVNPQGADTHYQFEYGATTSYGSKVPISSEDVGSGTTGVSLNQAVSSLEIGTTYHFRVTATNSEGTTNGGDVEFKTPDKPTVTTEAPFYTNTFEPQLNATVNPERADTHYQFEYGLTESYGTKIPTTAEDIGSDSTGIAVNQTLNGLERSKTYHYRIKAENEVGISYGGDKSFTTLPPCKGAEQKCLWSNQTPVDPSPILEDEMKSVSCPSSTMCIAVGKDLYKKGSFVERWNGSTWSLLQSVSGEIKHVSCVSGAAFCVGVGIASVGVPQSWMIYELSGVWHIEAVAPANPTGGSEAKLSGVSCTATACTAVGSYKYESTYKTLVETWNGSTWSIQSTPNPTEGSAQNAMLGVSCISSPTACVAVGEAGSKPVAEGWAGSEWARLPAPALPAGATGGRFLSVSCTSTLCIAVGDSYEAATGSEKALLESWNGIFWSILSSPYPSEAKGFVNLTGVSCTSSSACTAGGYYASKVSGSAPVETKTLAESWNGSSWTIQSTANATGEANNALLDISCTSSSACTAVGASSPVLLGAPRTIVERWNGSTWSTQAAVDPTSATEDEMKGASCGSTTMCLAVGWDLYRKSSFIERWNGSEWKYLESISGEIKRVSCVLGTAFCVAVGTSSSGGLQSWMIYELSGVWHIEAVAPVNPTGGSEAKLFGVGCTATACTAVGSYKYESAYKPLVERWNGSSWSLQAAPNPAEGTAQSAMLSVSCGSATSCLAVGEAASKPVAERWNGSEWLPTSSPALPVGAKGAKLASASCGSATSCMAVGDSYESGVGSEKPLVERWNGSSWSIIASPSPSGAKGFVNLTDVSCLSPNSCFVGGYYSSSLKEGGGSAENKTLVETWASNEWTIQSSTNAPGKPYSVLLGISCTSSIACTSVGAGSTGFFSAPSLLAERYE